MTTQEANAAGKDEVRQTDEQTHAMSCIGGVDGSHQRAKNGVVRSVWILYIF